MAKKITQKTKTPMPARDAVVRAQSFEEVALGYTIEMAVAEANRCIECKNVPCIAGCPVEIDIPTVLVKLRHDATKAKPHKAEDATFQAAAQAMSGRRRWTAALRAAKGMRFVRHAAPPPLSRWIRTRELPDPPAEPFRDWWRKR